MAILTEQTTQHSGGGFAKQIEETSLRMVYDNLQKNQYQYPHKSTIRELASNAIDAIRERDVARNILLGKARVEDHFVQREGELYKDSKFTPEYFDLTYLSKDPKVYIIYQEGGPLQRDKLIIRDNGVGLWGKRLEGYFKLAWSSKRLNNDSLGKFGVGAKAALATGVDYYKTITRYNGKETAFHVYSYQVEPITPRLNMATGKENEHFLMERGKDSAGNQLPPMPVYYVPTDQLNGVEIQLDVKKHHKQTYIDAVKQQLLYFDNIDFMVQQSDGRVEYIPIKAEILHEDQYMVISNNNMYSKPHILINKVNYGNIDFKEMELEDKMGNISVKVNPDLVSMASSREFVIWDDKTREAVIDTFAKVQKSAENLIQAELQETDFLRWVKKSMAVKNRINDDSHSGSVLQRLAKIVDLRGYTPVFLPDPEFKLDHKLFAGLRARVIKVVETRSGSSWKKQVEREPATQSDILSGRYPLIIQTGETSVRRDKYLNETVYPQGFITFNFTDFSLIGQKDEEGKPVDVWIWNFLDATGAELDWRLPPRNSLTTDAEAYKWKKHRADRVLERLKKVQEYIKNSEGIKYYEDFEVPEDYDRKPDKPEKEENDDKWIRHEETGKEARLSAEARRKLAGKTLLTFMEMNYTASKISQQVSDPSPFTWKSTEIEVKEIDEWDNDEIFYGSDAHKTQLQIAALIIRPFNEVAWGENVRTFVSGAPVGWPGTYRLKNQQNNSYENRAVVPSVRLMKVAQNRVKYYKDFQHIDKFFGQIKNNTITMSNALIKWNTARMIHKHLDSFKFLNNFEVFNDEITKKYNVLYKYCNTYFREIKDYVGPEELQDLEAHCDAVTEFQLFVRNHKDNTEAIAKRAIEFFGNDAAAMGITNGAGVDINMWEILQEVLEYTEPIKGLLNEMPVLHRSSNTISNDLEEEIRSFINWKFGK